MFKVTESCRIARIKRQDNQRLTVQIVDIFFETKIVHDLALRKCVILAQFENLGELVKNTIFVA
jgi:hypothetical protein